MVKRGNKPVIDSQASLETNAETEEASDSTAPRVAASILAVLCDKSILSRVIEALEKSAAADNLAAGLKALRAALEETPAEETSIRVRDIAACIPVELEKGLLQRLQPLLRELKRSKKQV